MSNQQVKFLTNIPAIITEFMGKASKDCALSEVLAKMAQQGQSVLLNWGEDDRLWECSWITSGKRYVSHALQVEAAVGGCIGKVLWEERQRRENA